MLRIVRHGGPWHVNLLHKKMTHDDLNLTDLNRPTLTSGHPAEIRSTWHGFCLTDSFPQWVQVCIDMLIGCRSFPSLLQFTSYMFSYHMILCGPFCFYQDYIKFIDGTNYSREVAADSSAKSAVGVMCFFYCYLFIEQRGCGRGSGCVFVTKISDIVDVYCLFRYRFCT